MENFNYGKRSQGNLETCHPDLRLVAETALKLSQVDITITEGERTSERQQMLFDTGKSKVNPKKYTPEVLITKGKHITNEFRTLSDAFDFIAAVPGKPKLAYDKGHLMYLVGVFTAVGEMLFQQGKITHKIRSGSNWDMDGELQYDQNFFDAPHIELIKA
jgi:hypothetical protein